MLQKNKKTLTAGVLLAAGNGLRFGGKKQFTKINQKQFLFEIPLQTIYDSNLFETIVVTLPEQDLEEIKEEVSLKYPGVFFITGGINRIMSIRNATEFLSTKNQEYLMLFDASRPIIKMETLKQLIKKTEETKKNHILTKKITDFIVKNNDSSDWVNRDDFHLTHTPHCYIYQNIYKTLKENKQYPEFDTVKFLQEQGFSVEKINIDYTDIKITYPEDLKDVENILRKINTIQ